MELPSRRTILKFLPSLAFLSLAPSVSKAVLPQTETAKEQWLMSLINVNGLEIIKDRPVILPNGRPTLSVKDKALGDGTYIFEKGGWQELTIKYPVDSGKFEWISGQIMTLKLVNESGQVLELFTLKDVYSNGWAYHPQDQLKRDKAGVITRDVTFQNLDAHFFYPNQIRA